MSGYAFGVSLWNPNSSASKEARNLMIRTTARWLCILFAIGWGFLGLLALVLILFNRAGWHGAADFAAPLVVGWGFLLHSWGVRDPWLDWGGGFVWLTEVGIMVVYFVPAALAGFVAILLQRRNHKAVDG